MEARIYEVEGKEQVKLKQLLEKDPYLDVSFARQGYKLKEGKGVGGEAGKYYLYIHGEPDFFKWAEEKFKGIPAPEGQQPAPPAPSLKRAEKGVEAKIIAAIEAEDNAAEVGMGAIFG
jgi:hypothetical protein